MNDFSDEPQFPNAPMTVFTLRPNGTSLWLPSEIAGQIAAEEGDTLTTEQFESVTVQELLAERIERQGAKRKKGGSRG